MSLTILGITISTGMFAAASYGCREIGRRLENWNDQRKRKKERTNEALIESVKQVSDPTVKTHEIES